MTYAEWAESFSIFAKYDGTAADVHAEHDEFWAGPSADLMSAEDRARLEAYGWTVDLDGGWHIFT